MWIWNSYGRFGYTTLSKVLNHNSKKTTATNQCSQLSDPSIVGRQRHSCYPIAGESGKNALWIGQMKHLSRFIQEVAWLGARPAAPSAQSENG